MGFDVTFQARKNLSWSLPKLFYELCIYHIQWENVEGKEKIIWQIIYTAYFR